MNVEIKLTKFGHESYPRLADILVNGVQSACISLLKLRQLPPAQPQTPHTSLNHISMGLIAERKPVLVV